MSESKSKIILVANICKCPKDECTVLISMTVACSLTDNKNIFNMLPYLIFMIFT